MMDDAWDDVGDGADLGLAVVVLILSAAALIKYLRSGRKADRR